ncbi:Uncharacterised protein [Mycobacterium tuberculosis]|nr:Uncharacterised protein [Mycobacterium tuberculosis]
MGDLRVDHRANGWCRDHPPADGKCGRPFFLKIESEVPVDVHPLVQDSHDVDGAFASHPIEQRV